MYFGVSGKTTRLYNCFGLILVVAEDVASKVLKIYVLHYPTVA